MQLLIFQGVWFLECCISLIEPADLQVLLHASNVDVDPLVHWTHAGGEEPLVADLDPARPLSPLTSCSLLLPDRGHTASTGHQRPANVPESSAAQGQSSQTDGVKIPAHVENNLNRKCIQCLDR